MMVSIILTLANPLVSQKFLKFAIRVLNNFIISTSSGVKLPLFAFSKLRYEDNPTIPYMGME